jgi:benzaldehyde dehydrogenase (NAD)
LVEAGGGVSNVIDPSNGDRLSVPGIANGEDVVAAAQVAERAQKKWAAIPFSERAAIVRKAAKTLKKREKEFADWNVRKSNPTVRASPALQCALADIC